MCSRHVEEFRRSDYSTCSSDGTAMETESRGSRHDSCWVDKISLCVRSLYSNVKFYCFVKQRLVWYKFNAVRGNSQLFLSVFISFMVQTDFLKSIHISKFPGCYKVNHYLRQYCCLLFILYSSSLIHELDKLHRTFYEKSAAEFWLFTN